MGQYNIPKLARNKYNFVKGLDGNNYVTQSQMMMSSGGGGINSNTFQNNSQLQSAIKREMEESYVVTSYDLKTINGYSLVGQGDIEIIGGDVDLSAYATKTYVADYVNTYAPTADLSAYATKTYVADYVATYAPEPDLSAYVSKIELNNASYVSNSALQNMSYLQTYTLTYAQYNNLSQAQKNDGRMYIISDMEYDVDMSYYVTKTELESASYVPYSELYKQLSSYATTTYVDEKFKEAIDASYAYTSYKTADMVTDAKLSACGYLTYANFEYDSVNNTLTIRI